MSVSLSRTLSRTKIEQTLSIIFAPRNYGPYIALNLTFAMSHIISAGVVLACVAVPHIVPLVKALASTSASAPTLAGLAIPIVRVAYGI